MRILVASAFVPGVDPTPPREVAGLIGALGALGHEAAPVVLPVSAGHAGLQEEILAFRLLEIAHMADRVITLRFPSSVLRHGEHIAWCTGSAPQPAAGDPGTGATDVGRRTTTFAWEAERRALAGALRVYAATTQVAERVGAHRNVSASVLPVPWDDATPPAGVVRAGHVYSEWPGPRAGLLWDAVAHAHDLAVVVAPAPASAAGEEAQRDVVTRGIADRVRFVAGEPARREALATAAAAVALRAAEPTGDMVDEAASLEVPCIACDDAGANADGVVHDTTGLVTAADAVALAGAMAALSTAAGRGRAMGGAARAHLINRTGTWDAVAEELAR